MPSLRGRAARVIYTPLDQAASAKKSLDVLSGQLKAQLDMAKRLGLYAPHELPQNIADEMDRLGSYERARALILNEKV